MMRRFVRLALASLVCWLLPANAAAQETIVGELTWMTQFPSTWNAGAPKLVSDGLFYYAVFCGRGGSSSYCTVARKRGDATEPWVISSRTFVSNQPAAVVIDRKGRLNIFYNDLLFRHIRVDHPAVNLDGWTSLATGFTPQVGYMHASYDPISDDIIVTLNETSTWRLILARKTGEGAWSYSTLPDAPAGVIYLYARTVAAPGRYAVLVGEHTFQGPNFAYTAAMLFESNSLNGPWTTRELHRVWGNNVGIPYENWVLANDLQIDAAGRLRALLHITENGSGHANPLDGIFILRQEDNYAPRFIGSGIEDGFTLSVDPSGVHLAFVRHLVPVPGSSAVGGIVWFRSNDNGATWQEQPNGYAHLVNPALVDLRSGSMLGPDLRFLATHWNPSTGAFDQVMFAGVTVSPAETADRYAHDVVDADGTIDYVRAFRDAASGREYSYTYDRDPDGSYSWTYNYSAGSYFQVYTADSDGSYRYYNSDGVDIADGPMTVTSLTPATVPLGSAATLVVTGTNFKAGAVIRIDGVARATTFVSSIQLTTAIVPGDAAVVGASKSVTVANPDGAISATLTVTITPSPATLIAAAATVSPGGTAAFTIANGPANRLDWVGWFCPASNNDVTYTDWKYFTNSRVAPSSGVTATTVTFTMSAAAGTTCDARLFAHNGFVRLVTSATVTATNLVPTVIAVTPASVPQGSARSITVTGTNFGPASVVHANGGARVTTFNSATQLSVALLAGDVATAGTSLPLTVVNPAPGGGTSNAVTLTVAAGPTITPAASNAPPTSTISFTVQNGPGNRTDWVGWYCPETEPDNAYLDWKYLNNTKSAPPSGLDSGTVTFTVRAGGGGACEARFFANNGFTELASASVTAIEFDWITLTLMPTAVAPGGTFTVTAVLGSPTPTSNRDWVGLFCPSTNGDMAYVDWKYMNNSKTAPAAVWSSPTQVTFTAPSGVGTKCDARLFRNNGFDKMMTSWPATVTILPAALTVGSATVGVSGTMSVTVANSPGNQRDWVGMYCPAANGDMTFADWKYLSGSRTPPGTGMTSATLTFIAPATAGTCNFRLFVNDGFTRLATSDTVTVQ